MAYRRKGQRNRGKKVTIAVLITGSNVETKHRGKTLKEALAVAAKSRLRPGCSFNWDGYGPHQGYAKGLKRLPGRTAGADGAVVCNGRRTSDAYLTVYRPRAKYTGSGKAMRRPTKRKGR